MPEITDEQLAKLRERMNQQQGRAQTVLGPEYVGRLRSWQEEFGHGGGLATALEENVAGAIFENAALVLALLDEVDPPPPPPPPPPPTHTAELFVDADAGRLEVVVSEGSPVDRVEFYIDDEILWTESVAPYGLPDGASTWDATPHGAGEHQARATAYFLDGTVIEMGPVGFTVEEPPPPPPPPPSGIEAPGAFAGSSAANQNVWRSGTRVTSSFVAEHTGTVERFRIHLRLAGATCDGSSSGYGRGDGGIARFEFYRAGEDGLPRGPMLSSEEFRPCQRNGGDQANMWAVANLPVVRGERYVAVISNVHPDPAGNHFSTNHGWVSTAGNRYDGLVTPLGERVRWSEDGGQSYNATGMYGCMFPTYLLEYADGYVQGARARGLWGGSATGAGSVGSGTVDYDYLAGERIVALGAYGANSGSTTLTLRVNGEVVATESFAGSRDEYLKRPIENVEVPEGATVRLAFSGSMGIYRMGTHYPWLDSLGLADSYLYSFSAYPLYLI